MAGVTAGAGIRSGEILVLQVSTLQQRVEDIRNDLTRISAEHRRFMSAINTNVRRIAVQPVVRGQVNDHRTQALTRAGVKLSKSPKDLWTLWQEYESGLNGQRRLVISQRRREGQTNLHIHAGG